MWAFWWRCRARTITYPETRTVLRTHFISFLDTPRVHNICLISRKHKVVDEVVVEFGEKKHIGSIGHIGLQVHVGMRDESLLECVECNNPASAIIEGIRRLSKIGAPADEAKLGEACLYVCIPECVPQSEESGKGPSCDSSWILPSQSGLRRAEWGCRHLVLYTAQLQWKSACGMYWGSQLAGHLEFASHQLDPMKSGGEGQLQPTSLN